MALYITLAILFGFTVALWCPEFLGASQMAQIHGSQSFSAQLAAGILLLAAVTTFALTLLLLFAYVRALGADAAGGGGAAAAEQEQRRFLERLAKATFAVAAASLLAGASLGRLAGGGDDVGWLPTTK